jgi:NADH-quinone oxidoreductase subunit N
VGYYFKLILAMYTKEASEDRKAVPFVYYAVAVIAILLNIVLGIYPSLVTNLLN